MSARGPAEKKQVHDGVAAALASFGKEHLDPELTAKKGGLVPPDI